MPEQDYWHLATWYFPWNLVESLRSAITEADLIDSDYTQHVSETTLASEDQAGLDWQILSISHNMEEQTISFSTWKKEKAS